MPNYEIIEGVLPDNWSPFTHQSVESHPIQSGSGDQEMVDEEQVEHIDSTGKIFFEFNIGILHNI